MKTIGNYEYQILSHLKDRKGYSWGVISSFLPGISDSTLLDNLKRLIRSESIVKERTVVEGKQKKRYRITEIGLEKQRFLKTLVKGIIYPPDYIPFESDEERIIWLLNTNEFCRWKHFEDQRLGIGKGSLNNALNKLIQKKVIEKKIISGYSRPVYGILNKGRDMFMIMLEKYNVDKDFSQREKFKTIKRIVEETEAFVDKIDIDNEKVLIRFFQYVDLLKNEKLRTLCKSSEHFYITLLYLAFNHPYQYPHYVPVEIFSKKFEISEITLLYYLESLGEPEFKDIFVKVAVLSKDREFTYYFLKKGRLSQKLRIFIEEYIEDKIYGDALKGQKIVIDDIYFSKIDISELNKLIFERYTVLPVGLKKANLLKNYLEQLSSQYTLKDLRLNIDLLKLRLFHDKNAK